jgi:hypothetical protein
MQSFVHNNSLPVLVVVVFPCDVHVSMVLQPSCWLVLLLLLACGSIGCFFVSVVQKVSNLSCRDELYMMCFVAAVVFHPPLDPMPSTITDAFCWHSLAPALSCQHPLLLSHQHHYHNHNYCPHSTMFTCTIKAAPYCCCC